VRGSLVVNDVPVWLVGVAAVPGVIALVLGIALWTMVRRLREAQQVLLSDGTSESLVERQSAQQRSVQRLEEHLRGLEDRLTAEKAETDEALGAAIRFQGLVRYDAYSDMGGQQSWSVALLDRSRTGSIVTSLHARDHARVYLKQLVGGEPSQRLSPEEERAVLLAMGELEDQPEDAAQR
jgi:hypothetical protein